MEKVEVGQGGCVPTWGKEWATCALAFAFYCLTAVRHNPHIEHALQAWLWLHGHIALSNGVMVWEHVNAGGYAYILHPPLAALVCVPFVLLGLPQWFAEVLIAAYAVKLVYRLTRSFELTVFFAVGTTFWYEATLGASWGFCLILATVPTLKVLLELLRYQKPFIYHDVGAGVHVRLDPDYSVLVGIWGGLACLARYDMVLALPVYAWLVWKKGGLKWTFLIGPAICFIAYVAYNYARFGTWNDVALWLWYQSEDFGAAAHPGHGPFSLAYLPYNIYTALFMAPWYVPAFPWIEPQVSGQALILTSPALILALRQGWRDPLWWALGAVMIPSLLVYSNGAEQFGCRYWIMALPFFMALIAKGQVDRLTRVLIGASVAIQMYGIYAIRY